VKWTIEVHWADRMWVVLHPTDQDATIVLGPSEGGQDAPEGFPPSGRNAYPSGANAFFADAHLMGFEFPVVLLVDLSDLLVQEYVSVHGLFARSLHNLMELGCDSLVSGLSFICFAKSLSDLSAEGLLDILGHQVQKLNLLVDSGEFSTHYLDPCF